MSNRASGASAVTVIVSILAFLVVVGIAGAVGIYFVGRHVVRAVESRVEGSSSPLARIAQSVTKPTETGDHSESSGCALLSQDDASAISGTKVTRVESTADSCSYFGVPDPSVQPEAAALQGLPGAADPQVTKMIGQFATAMRANAEAQDPDIRPGPGGERLLFGVGSSPALSATMAFSKLTATPQMGGELVPGIGDEAFFATMHRMFFVRVGGHYLLIQPQFVKDPRGVCIAVAKKVLASPEFTR